MPLSILKELCQVVNPRTWGPGVGIIRDPRNQYHEVLDGNFPCIIGSDSLRRQTRMKRLIGLAIIFLVLISAPAHAQWVKVPQPKIPRSTDGKANLSAPAPRTAYGKPDLSGIWNVDNKYVRDLAADFPPEYVPFQPWAKALFDERKDGAHSYEDNAAHCLPPGTPRVNAAPFPWKLVQQPDYILIIYENFNMWRQVFLDGRVVAEDAVPTWFGYSTGKWEGDTLVVDTTGFTGKAWLD